MRSLAIGPQEAFVLSRVDGASSEAQIAAATGLDLDSVRASLGRLRDLGAIRYPDEDSARPSGPRAVQHAQTPPVSDSLRLPFALFDPRELDEEVELSPDRKQQILQVFYALEEVTHYELLGVSPDSDKKTIKDAYFKIVNLFHPDRYFGRSLGSFKAKLERVFARMTEAHEVLTRKATRAEYDAYLATKNQTRRLDELLTNSGAVAEEVERVQAQIERDALTNGREREPTDNASKASTAPPSTAMTDAIRQRLARGMTRKASDPEVRKRALARKLRGSAAPPMRMSGTIPAVQIPEDREILRAKVDGDLKARYQYRIVRARQEQVRRYMQAADQAETDKDPVSAANALKIALQLDPDNEPLSKRLDAVQMEATRTLADSYLEQAQYEEREGHFDRAGSNYERAAMGKESPPLYDRAASCFLEAGTDLKRAGDLARKAVELAPDSAQFRITLARIYGRAKMLNSAVKEAERAVRLAPDDETAKTWLKRIKREDF